MSDSDGLIHSIIRSPGGEVRETDWNGIRAHRPEDGWIWLHLDRLGERSQQWIRNDAGLDEVSAEALLDRQTRPRLLLNGERLLLVMRGVNMNPGAEPADMIALSMWIEPGRVITLRNRRLLAVREVYDEVLAGAGPQQVGEFLPAIVDKLLDRQAVVVESIEEGVDEIEETLLQAESHRMRGQIAELRRQLIGLRRYLAPQRDVLNRLCHAEMPWVGKVVPVKLREAAERQLRLVEELDSARDRAAIASEELAGKLADQMNRNMYVLSLVAGVFLPLGLLTGLLGINVGGMPGSESPEAFWIVCGLLLVLAAVVLWFFRRAKML